MMVEVTGPDRPILAVDDRVEGNALAGEGFVEQTQLGRKPDRGRDRAAGIPDL
ncbi:hypothetical protein D3C78_1914060 [compost metagenome]